MGKKPKHRVRHTPPGPCGVWFQATQAKKKQRLKEANSAAEDGNRRQSLEEETPNLQQQLSKYNTKNANGSPDDRDKDDNDDTDNNNTPSAWQAMQTDTGVTTPFNPTPWDETVVTTDDSESRYNVIRLALPPHYATLWEILRGDHDMKLAPQQRLRVLVHAVEMSSNHNIWTVNLRDDTGACVKAWMEPGFIQEQLQNSSAVDDEMSMVRPGLVWMLKDCSMIIMPSSATAFVSGSDSGNSSSNNNISEERLERMLLISREHIESTWYPAAAKKKNNAHHTLEASQQSQSSGNNEDPAINLEGNNMFGDGKQFESPTLPLPQRNIINENAPNQPSTSSSAPRNEESVTDLFNQSRRKSLNKTSTEQDSSLTNETDRPHTQELGQFAALEANSVNTPQQQSQKSNLRKKSPSLTPLEMSVLGMQEASQTSQNNNTLQGATADLQTQESMADGNDSQQQSINTNAQTSHLSPPLHTPKRKKGNSTQRQSSSNRRKKQKATAATSPVHTPNRRPTSTQDSSTALLTPTPTRRRKRTAMSPKAKAMNHNLWTHVVFDPVFQEMILEDETHEEAQREMSQQQQKQPSNSEASVYVPMKERDYGTLFDPKTWKGVDMSIFDDNV